MELSKPHRGEAGQRFPGACGAIRADDRPIEAVRAPRGNAKCGGKGHRLPCRFNVGLAKEPSV